MASLKWLGEHIDTIHIASGEVCCANCRHFRLHYVRLQDNLPEKYMPTAVGHCVYPRLKDRRAYDRCGDFERKDE